MAITSIKICEVETSDTGVVQAIGFDKVIYRRVRTEKSMAGIGPGIVSDVLHVFTNGGLPLIVEIHIIFVVAK